MFEPLGVGNKVELLRKNKGIGLNTGENLTYVSQIRELSDDSIVIAMPIYEGRLIAMEVGTEYEAYFYTRKGIQRSDCKVLSRKKEDNIYTAQIMLTTELKKFQRRQFYRLKCVIDVMLSEMPDYEKENYIARRILKEDSDYEDKGVMVDISGGGARVLSSKLYKKNSYIRIKFLIVLDKKNIEIATAGRIVASFEHTDRKNLFDNRIQFDSDRDIQNKIVKYIFEQQRLLRQRER